MLNVLNKFTAHYRNILAKSYAIASEGRKQIITPVHVVMALLEEKGSVAYEVLHKTRGSTAKHPSESVSKPLESHIGSVTASAEVVSIIEKSVLLAAKLEHQYVGSEHLLWALVNVLGDKLNTTVEGVTFDMESLGILLSQVLRGVSRFPDLSQISEEEEAEVDIQEKNKLKKRKIRTQALDYFATNLTNKRIEKKIDPVIGREKEIERIIQILGRRTKNNPVLLGEPGVGKTAIVEGLAKKIVAGEVPNQLLNRKIYSLDLSLMVAGSMYRGEFEQRLKQVIEDIQSDPDIILFIDEIHTIVGAGAAGGSLDAANILKPALARGQIRCIGATTYEEYKKHIESDSALERRFQPVMVRELTGDESLAVLRGIRSAYEAHHAVTITDDAIEAAVSLSSRYLPEKHLPDKAIDLIDEASSRSAIVQGQDSRVRELHDLEREFGILQEKKQEAVKKEHFPEALEYKKLEEVNLARQGVLRSELDRQSPAGKRSITSKDIIAVVSEMTHIPIGELEASERKRFVNLQELLAKEIFGQSEVLGDIVGYIKRARSGLAGRERPLGSFLFLGPTGVGKTETARVLAKSVFGSEDRLLRVDMSEFSEAFTVSRLVGAPAGYVGYREGGMLTEAVRKNPYSVVLFDEIEKAHSDVFNILLQVFDAGQLTDAAGKRVNFRNTIIILTSNIGMKSLNEAAKIGFTAESTTGGIEELERTFNEQKEEAIKGVKNFFRPEFLNRLDKIIVFKPLTESALLAIAEKELDKLRESLHEQKIEMQWSPSLEKVLIEGFSPTEGGRIVQRNVHERIENELADKIIAGELRAGSTVTLRLKEGKIIFDTVKKKTVRTRGVIRVKQEIKN